MSISKFEYDGLCASQESKNEFLVVMDKLKCEFSVNEIESMFKSCLENSKLGKFEPSVFDIELWEDDRDNGWLYGIFKGLAVGNFDQGVLLVNVSLNAYISSPRVTVNKLVIEELSSVLSSYIAI